MNWLNGLTDGQVVGGLVFVVVPLALLGLLWLEGRLETRSTARRARARTRRQVLDELAARRDEARERRRLKVLALNASDPHPYRSRLAAQKLREFMERGLLNGGSVSWTGGRDDEA